MSDVHSKTVKIVAYPFTAEELNGLSTLVTEILMQHRGVLAAMKTSPMLFAMAMLIIVRSNFAAHGALEPMQQIAELARNMVNLERKHSDETHQKKARKTDGKASA